MYLKAKDYDESLPSEGPDPESRWGLIFDGAVNSYGNGIGEVIVTLQVSHIPFTARLTFTCRNNVAEYEVCIMGLEEAIDLRIKILDVYGDSALVINHIKGEWETCQPGLIPYKDYARRLSTFFNQSEFHHIPREENQIEDALATLSPMIVMNRWNDVPTINVMRLDRPAHVFAVEEFIDGKPWYHDIKCFIQRQEYPPGASNKDKKTLIRLAGTFFLNEDVLYKRNFDMTPTGYDDAASPPHPTPSAESAVPDLRHHMPGTDYNTAIQALMSEQDAIREELTMMGHEFMEYMS
ncbi:uncharacterized protein LOC127110626 [Lathyrus oleraceus]|uniref:uncharacterized protein LOC127110626 n=1 Tax=Pisum sativum TaxID=3888 RepID=UPI0021D03EE2|nr:uncharacterized protein LOC127110626 [Pisum sativum]